MIVLPTGATIGDSEIETIADIFEILSRAKAFASSSVRRLVFGGQRFGAFWHLCRFTVEADRGAEPAVVGVGEAVFGFQRTTELIGVPFCFYKAIER